MTLINKYASIGYRIVSIRNAFHLTQAKFAVSLGISRPALSAIESGITKPSLPILFVIEFKYNYRHEWILTGDGEIYVDQLSLLVRDSQVVYKTSNRVLNIWIDRLIRIFEEGDEKKIEAIKSSIRALDPSAKKQDLPKKEDASIDKKAM
jgi:transcriptional regulator with XRE-family HTH domain